MSGMASFADGAWTPVSDRPGETGAKCATAGCNIRLRGVGRLCIRHRWQGRAGEGPQSGSQPARTSGSSRMNDGRTGTTEHPCEKASSWLLSQFGRSAPADGSRMGDITVRETARELDEDEDHIRECFTMLLKAQVVVNLSQEHDPRGPFEIARWQGLRRAEKASMKLQVQAEETFPMDSSTEAAPLKETIIRGTSSRGDPKLSRFGVFSAAMQVVMASLNGITLDTTATYILHLSRLENPSGTININDIGHHVSNALHTMVGLGAIKKEQIPHTSTGDVFTWVGWDLEEAPLPPTPSATAPSHGAHHVRGPGERRAAPAYVLDREGDNQAHVLMSTTLKLKRKECSVKWGMPVPKVPFGGVRYLDAGLDEYPRVITKREMQRVSPSPRANSRRPLPTAKAFTDGGDEEDEELFDNKALADDRAPIHVAPGGGHNPENTKTAVDNALAVMKAAKEVENEAAKLFHAAAARSGLAAKVTMDAAGQHTEVAMAYAAAVRNLSTAIQARDVEQRRKTEEGK
ncbi:unnamed protein product [Scytosiphon promiscuus]